MDGREFETTKFRDGSPIPIVAPSPSSPKVSCYYSELDPTTKDSLGLLYTWFAQRPGEQWHERVISGWLAYTFLC